MERWNATAEEPLCVGDRIIALNGEALQGEDLLERLKLLWPNILDSSWLLRALFGLGGVVYATESWQSRPQECA